MSIKLTTGETQALDRLLRTHDIDADGFLNVVSDATDKEANAAYCKAFAIGLAETRDGRTALAGKAAQFAVERATAMEQSR